nr:AraC family transcriptional regulator [Neorhizobium sp. AL 9.2.2]
MLFFAVSDAALSVYTTFNGRDDIPLVLTAINIVVLVVTGIYYFAPEAAESPLPNGKAPEANPQDERLVQRATEALDRDGLYRDENLSLAKLARKAGVPARDLSVAINRATGLNISQFVNRRRIAEACVLLRETSRPATIIMFDVGFSTKSNFNREFRRVTGMSPRQWRSGSKSIADPGNIGLDVPVANKQLGAVKP